MVRIISSAKQIDSNSYELLIKKYFVSEKREGGEHWELMAEYKFNINKSDFENLTRNVLSAFSPKLNPKEQIQKTKSQIGV